MALQDAEFRADLEDRQGRNHAQIVRPQHADQPFRELRQFVVQFLTQAPQQEGEALEQPLYMRVALSDPVNIKQPGTIRMRLGKFLAGFAQVTHFSFVIAQYIMRFIL